MCRATCGDRRTVVLRSASGRRGSNPRHQAWKACALPAELLPRGLPSPRYRRRDGGGRIRTFEGFRRQIYSLIPLATWVPHRTRALRESPIVHATACRVRADGENRTRNRLI